MAPALGFLALAWAGSTPPGSLSLAWAHPRSGQELVTPTYDAPRAAGPLNLDGALTDAAWASAPWTHDFVDIRGGEWPAPALRTRAKLLWDDEFLYIGAELEEPHLWATLLERDDIVYRDDDFEVFLDPDGDGLAYFEVEINALGTEMDLFLERPYNTGGRADLGWDLAGLKTGTWLHGTLNDPVDLDRGWGVELAIPWGGLVPPGSAPTTTAQGDSTAPASTRSPFPRSGATDSAPGPREPGQPPRPGDTWRVNFSRVDWPLEVSEGRYVKARLPTRDDPHPESNWVWSPQGVIDMHLPAQWGVVRFVER